MNIKPSWTYRATTNRLTDGDTIHMTVDVGFRLTATVRIRLEGIDAPPSSTIEGAQATEWLRSWLDANPNQVITTSGEDKYGRWLAVVRSGDVCLNDLMVTVGHARRWSGKGAKPWPATPSTPAQS